MNIVIFGASGMVGQGVLRECLLDKQVTRVVTIGRTSLVQTDSKLKQVVHSDFEDFSPIESELRALDACFFCLGVASAGMNEADYTRVTYDFTLAAATLLARLNPAMTFIFVSGASTDSTEKGDVMWARVKGRTENALLRLPFKNVYAFRPGIIQPLHGIKSKTSSYRVFYLLAGPLIALLRPFLPKYITTTEQIGLAMLKLAKTGGGARVLTTEAINAVVQQHQ